MVDRDAPFGTFAPTGALAFILKFTRDLPGHGAGKRLGFIFRRLASPLLHGRLVDVESFGAKFRLLPYNNVCESRILFFPRLFDEPERVFLAQRITPDFRFIDIGANIGGYALFVAALAGPKARILAIDPLPDVFNRLVANIRLNPFGTIKALALAVADKDETRTLFVDARNQGESSLKILTAAESQSIRVPARRLMTILRDEKFDKIDAMKVDVEGAEDLVLETFFASAPESLYPGAIVLQATPRRWHSDLVALIESKGYRKVGETRNNYLFERGYAAD